MRTKLLKTSALLLTTIMCFAACSSEPSGTPDLPSSSGLEQSSSPAATPSGSPPQDSAVPQNRPMKIEYTSAFSVMYITDDILLVTDAENQKFLLVPRGQEAPAGYDDALLLYTPVERVLFSSSTQFGMVAPFDVWDHAAAIISTPADWPFPELNERIANGSISYVGSSMGADVDYEMVQEINPDIAFVYTGQSAQTELIEKLKELGIPHAVDNEYMEANHAGRMEWIKFLAPFFGKADEAVEYVDAAFARLAEMEAKVAQADKPKVAWGRVSDGIGRVPGGDSYVAKMLEAVGCDYVFSYLDGNGTAQIDLEEFYTVMKEVDIWVHSSSSTYMPNYSELLSVEPILADVPCVTDKNVWQIGLDYYSLTGEIDLQAIELAAIIHPDLYPDYSNYRHFNKLAE